jgi:alkylhydroperoxidase family enzyme
MARIKGITTGEENEAVRVVFEEQEKRYGFVSNTAKIYALRPTIQQGVQALAQGILASGLIEPDLRHLLCVKTANINGCPFWIDINASSAMHNGAAAEKVEAVLGNYKKNTLFSLRERLALELAERMTYTGKRVTDRFFNRLKRHFTDEELVELAAVIALENFRSKFNPVFGIEPNGFCPLPSIQKAAATAVHRFHAWRKECKSHGTIISWNNSGCECQEPKA